MALSSSAVGSTITGRLDAFDIVLHLTTGGSAEANNPSYLTTINKGHVVEGIASRRERNYAPFVVLEAIVHLHKRGIPIEFARHIQRNSVLRKVVFIFSWIELDTHALL
jgi:hypothetical protein